MEAKFISNVDPDDAAAVLNSIDVAHSLSTKISKMFLLVTSNVGISSDIPPLNIASLASRALTASSSPCKNLTTSKARAL